MPIGLSNRSVRILGAGTLLAALGLPIAALAWFHRSHPTEALAPARILRPEMVILPAASFQMGSGPDQIARSDDEVVHAVRVGSFAISRTEVTASQFRAVMGRNPMNADSDCSPSTQGASLPAVCIQWMDAITYANALSRLEGLEPVYVVTEDGVRWDRDRLGYRLLTEAEWEYAARAGTEQIWVGSALERDACRFGNVRNRVALRNAPEGPGQTTAAGDAFPCQDGFSELAPAEPELGPAEGDPRLPNRFGVYGLGGNASEWVWDWMGDYSSSPNPVLDPTGPDKGTRRIVRGANWASGPDEARIARRQAVAPAERSVQIGFRIARSTLPASP